MALRRSRKLREPASAGALSSSWEGPSLGSALPWIWLLLGAAVGVLLRFPQGLGSAAGTAVVSGRGATGRGASGVGVGVARAAEEDWPGEPEPEEAEPEEAELEEPEANEPEPEEPEPEERRRP